MTKTPTQELYEALKKIEEFLNHRGWGTWYYMEGSQVFIDINNAKEVVKQALSNYEKQLKEKGDN